MTKSARSDIARAILGWSERTHVLGVTFRRSNDPREWKPVDYNQRGVEVGREVCGGQREGPSKVLLGRCLIFPSLWLYNDCAIRTQSEVTRRPMIRSRGGQ